MSDLELSGHVPAVSRDRNPYWCYLARLRSAESRHTKQGCLDRIAAILLPLPGEVPAGYGERVPWWLLTYGQAMMLHGVLTARMDAGVWSAAHVNKHLSALRRVIFECWRLGYLDADQRDRLRDFPQVEAVRERAGRNVRPDETALMLAACAAEDSPIGVRDAAVIAVLQSTGGRRSEIAGLLIEDYDHAERSVRVIGKGNKQRTGYLHPAAAGYVDRWLVLVGERQGPVFRRVDRWGNIGAFPLTSRAVGLIVDHRRGQCRLPPLSTHDYRRTFIGELLDAGADLVTVQELVGHQNPGTTAAYDRRPGRTRRAAVDLLTLPAVSGTQEREVER